MIFVLTAWNLFPSGGNDTVHYDRHKRGRLGTKAPNLAITTHATISGGRIKGGIVALADRRVGRLTRRLPATRGRAFLPGGSRLSSLPVPMPRWPYWPSARPAGRRLRRAPISRS